jgi:hypothetical protein
MAENLKKKIENTAKMPSKEIKSVLPAILGEIEKHGVVKLLGEMPDLYRRLITALIEIDAAKFGREAPDSLNKFLTLFWDGLIAVGSKNKEVKETCAKISEGVKITQLSINFEATDSPLQAHFIVNDKAQFQHGLGLLHFKDQDFKMYGPTESLMKLFIGEATLGAWSELDYEGHIGPFGLKMSPVLKALFTISGSKN